MTKFKLIFYSILLVILSAAVYFRLNTGDIYAHIGNYYYKCNNIPKAQMFYEKSFYMGNENTALRETYVNSIINSPLTVESQEKLVKIAKGNINDRASEKSKFFLYDLKREVHRKYKYNYIKQAPYNQKIVRWNKMPVTYCYKNVSSAPQDYIKEIDNAFAEWEKNGPILFSKIDNPKDEYTLLILSRLSELLPSGCIIPPPTESYVNTQCHFIIPHFHEMKKTYYQYKLKEISPWISLLALITSVIASTFSILTYLK